MELGIDELMFDSLKKGTSSHGGGDPIIAKTVF